MILSHSFSECSVSYLSIVLVPEDCVLHRLSSKRMAGVGSFGLICYSVCSHRSFLSLFRHFVF